MQPTTSRRFGVTVLIVALASPLAVAAGYAQTQGMGAGRIAERTEATRDTRQEGRRNARDVKQECREGDDSRAECRQQKRGVKRDARHDVRDIKTND